MNEDNSMQNTEGGISNGEVGYEISTLSVEEINARIAALQQIASQKFDTERSVAIKTIKQQIAKYNITAQELGIMGKRTGQSVRQKSPQTKNSVTIAAGSYRHPETGIVYQYSGRGRKAKWLQEMSQEQINACRVD